MDCGHFRSRRYNATRFDETNCQVQCPKCNRFNEGEHYQFGINLNIKYGPGTAEGLIAKSRELVKITEIEYDEMIKYYQDKVKALTVGAVQSL